MIHLKEASFFSEEFGCKVCVRRALDGLRAVEGVVAVRVSTAPLLDEETAPGLGVATVKFHPEFVSLEQLQRVLEHDLGFTVNEVRIEEPPITRAGSP